jgi:hypothetical protein
MTNIYETERELDARTQQALTELQGLIQAQYPEASFAVAHGEDPEGIYLKATVDVDDIDAVVDVFMDRLLELQVEDGLPIYVIPLEPMERVLATMRAQRLPRRYQALGGAVLNP